MIHATLTQKSLQDAYILAFGEATHDFTVTSLGAGLSMDVECMTNLPTSTPAEKRAAKTERDMKHAQQQAERRQKRIERAQMALARKRQRTLEKQARTGKVS